MEVFNLLFNQAPKITKILILSSFSISILVWSGLITTLDIYLNYSLILKRFQIWRILTSFLYFGELNLSLVFNMVVFFRDSKDLEKKIFHGSCADYLYFLLFCMFFLLFLSTFTKSVFLSSSLNFAMMYYWGRKSKTTNVEFMGIFAFPAPYLSIFYLLIMFLLGYDYKNLFYGIIVGHVYFFGKEILPRIKGLNGIKLLETPEFIIKLCEFFDLNNDFIIENEEPNLMF
jgi:Derlin-2/3